MFITLDYIHKLLWPLTQVQSGPGVVGRCGRARQDLKHRLQHHWKTFVEWVIVTVVISALLVDECFVYLVCFGACSHDFKMSLL